MFTKLPEFVACNLKCHLLVLQRLVKCSVNDTEIYGDWCFDGTEKLRVAHLENFVKNVWNHYAHLFLTQTVRVLFSSKI